MIVLGIILALIGYFTAISILTTVGIILGGGRRNPDTSGHYGSRCGRSKSLVLTPYIPGLTPRLGHLARAGT